MPKPYRMVADRTPFATSSQRTRRATDPSSDFGRYRECRIACYLLQMKPFGTIPALGHGGRGPAVTSDLMGGPERDGDSLLPWSSGVAPVASSFR